MLRRLLSFFRIVLLVVSITGGFLLIGASSPSYKKCYSENQAEKQKTKTLNASPETDTTFTHFFVLFSCEAHFADENNGLITALATVTVAAFTVVLAYSTWRQARLTQHTLELARDEFTASHRPKMIVHFINRLPPVHPDHEPTEQSISVEFRIENAGTGDAYVTGSRIRLDHFHSGQWPFPDDLRGEDLIVSTGGRRRFKVGASDRITVSTDAHGGLRERMATEGQLYLIGWIVYEDASKNPLTTYFCRGYSHKTGRFTPAANCDYEDT